MEKFRNFIKTTVLGGLVVVLPVYLTYVLISWIYGLLSGVFQPLTRIVMEVSRLQRIVADVLAVAVILLAFFVIGLVVKTRFGKTSHQWIEKRILRVAPGYSLFRETIRQFLGQKRAPFSRVALVRLFENSTMMTGFVTDEHEDGSYTVYVPSGLNPTTGLLYHLQKPFVHLVDVSVEETMRSIIGCGAGSKPLIDSYMRGAKKGGEIDTVQNE